MDEGKRDSDARIHDQIRLGGEDLSDRRTADLFVIDGKELARRKKREEIPVLADGQHFFFFFCFPPAASRGGGAHIVRTADVTGIMTLTKRPFVRNDRHQSEPSRVRPVSGAIPDKWHARRVMSIAVRAALRRRQRAKKETHGL